MGRSIRRRFRGVKGVLLGVGIGLFLAAMLAPYIVMSIEGGARQDLESSEFIRQWGPTILLALVLVSGISTHSLYFKPAEIAYLFPAPVSRRQLVVYNVLSKVKIQVLSALWCSIFLLPRASRWYAAVTSIILALTFVQLVSQASGLCVSAVSEALGKRLRRALLALLAALVITGVLIIRAEQGEGVALGGVLRAFVDLPAVKVVSWITRPFVEVFLADSAQSYVMWTAATFPILAILVLSMFVLDVAYTERALVASRRVQERLRRFHSGGGAFAASPRKIRISLPRFPRLGGAGPAAWRQCVELTRNFKSVLFLGILVVLPLGFTLFGSGSGSEPGPETGPGGLAPLPQSVVFILVMSFFLTNNVLFDFRRDLDRMGYLKTLPIRPIALSCGQLLGTAGLLLLVQTVALVAVNLATGDCSWPLIIGIAGILAPFDWIAVALDNALFLYFPYRLAPKDAGQFPFMGRIMLVMFLKMLVLGMAGGGGFLVAFLAYSVTGESYVAGAVAAAVFAAALGVPAVWIVAHAFRKFDVSRHGASASSA